MTTKLSKEGYKVIKKNYSTKLIKEIKEELCVKPYSYNKQLKQDNRFMVYLESPKKLYLPRFYGLLKFGMPTLDLIEEGESIDLIFKGEL